MESTQKWRLTLVGSRLQDMLAKIDDKYDKSEGMFFYDTLSPVEEQLEELAEEIEYTKQNMDVRNKKGEDLDIYIEQRTSLKRYTSTKSTVMVTIRGKAGLEVDEGTLVSSKYIIFETIEKKVIPAEGEVEIEAKCQEFGVIGNVPAKTIIFFPITYAGLTDCTNKDAATGGIEKEEDDSFRNRYLTHLQTPATGGNKQQYIKWAKEVEGVGIARVLPAEEKALVRVLITNAVREPPNDILIKKVSEYIEDRRILGAKVEVEGVRAKDMSVSCNITIDGSNFKEDIEERAKEAIDDFLYEIALTTSIVSIAKIAKILLEINGIYDINFASLLINEANENLTLAENEVAVLKEVNLYD